MVSHAEFGQCVKNKRFLTCIMSLSGESRAGYHAGLKMTRERRGRIPAWACVVVQRCDWGLHGWNFPSAPKEGAPRLSISLPRCGAERKQVQVRLTSSQQSNKKCSRTLCYKMSPKSSLAGSQKSSHPSTTHPRGRVTEKKPECKETEES